MTKWEGTERPTDTPSFGATATAYTQHRLGFPTSMYDTWQREGILSDATLTGTPMTITDMGTGTGTLARTVAGLGHKVTGLDIDAAMLAEAKRLATADGLDITFRQSGAEDTGLDDGSQDLVTAGQCWHWFDRPAAALEIHRILRPGGMAMICYYDWLPLPGTMVAATEALILDFNPSWRAAGGTGVYAHWHTDLAVAGFSGIRSFTYDKPAPYSPEAWVGRIEASAGIAALSPEKRETFKSALAAMLDRDYAGAQLMVPHRVFCLWGQKEKI